MKYRIEHMGDELVVIVEDGGIACIRSVDELDEGDGRQTTIDYYQERLTQSMIDNDTIWEELGEGDMYYNDFKTPYTDPSHIQNALEWLCVGETNFEVDETIWKDA